MFLFLKGRILLKQLKMKEETQLKMKEETQLKMRRIVEAYPKFAHVEQGVDHADVDVDGGHGRRHRRLDDPRFSIYRPQYHMFCQDTLGRSRHRTMRWGLLCRQQVKFHFAKKGDINKLMDELFTIALQEKKQTTAGAWRRVYTSSQLF